MRAYLAVGLLLLAPPGAPPGTPTPSGKPVVPLKDLPELAESAPLERVPPKSRPLKEWVRDVESSDSKILFAAVTALETLGAEAKPVVPQLMEIIERDQSPARLAAIEILGAIGRDSAPAVPILTKSLAHADFHTQYFALRTLAKIGPESKPALPEMLRVLKSGPASTRKNAATALGDLGPQVVGDDAVDGLNTALADVVFPVREQAALALGKLGERSRPALPLLRELATNKQKSTRAAAAYAVWQIAGDIDFALPIILDEMQRLDNPMEAMRTIARIGALAKAAVRPLTERLKDPDPELRLLAIEALAAIGPAASSAREDLQQLLNDEEKDVREAAEAALKALAPPP